MASEQHLLGITTTKADNFSDWYSQVIVKGDLIEYYDISGCYILRPNIFFVWEMIQEYFNAAIRVDGVDNSYFPMFVAKKHLEAEEDHVEGFSPEVAWVTRYSDTDLAEPIAIRPTSETIMYPAFSKWIRSHRDLPLKLNQWCPVVRWEFKQPTPFIRTREFLWQEGHTAHATHEEATEEMLFALNLYADLYRDLLCIPCVKGLKSIGERFPGGVETSTVEVYISANGRSIQAATSHLLGSNFAQMFNIRYENEQKEKKFVHQTSWGLSTRSLGAMIMVHGDDKGIVMPPKVAKIQVVIVPIPRKSVDPADSKKKINEIVSDLKKVGIRIRVDDSNNKPGWKYNHWEVRGVPVRLELGPKDIAHEEVRLVKRHNGEKKYVKWSELSTEIPKVLEEIGREMYDKASRELECGIVQATTFEEVMPALNKKKLLLLPWCCDEKTEDEIKDKTAELSKLQVEAETSLTSGMKPLCIPLEQPEMPEGMKCFWTGRPAEKWCLFGRSY